MRLPWLCVVLVCACDVSSDAFWDDTTEDTGDTTTTAMAVQRVAIAPGETNNAELVELLPVARKESGATRRIVLRLSPSELPGLGVGDRLIVPAEVQVTTRCDVGQTAPGCNYSPNIKAQLLLTANAGDTDAAGSSRVIATREQSCTKAEHHCRFVFRAGDAALVLPDIPCVATDSCFVNLVMWAWHPDARSGDQDKVLVGGNDGNYLLDGKVEQDQARLMAVRERGITAADRAMRETHGGGDKQINTSANAELVFSHKLKDGDLVKGEQFVIEAKLVTAVSSRARFSTQLFVTKDPHEVEGGGFDRITPSAISEHNGINCTADKSPCTTRKVAVFRVDEDVAGPVFVNIYAKSEVPGGGSARVVVKRGDSYVRSVRYGARFAE
jgi:hypothetical protein